LLNHVRQIELVPRRHTLQTWNTVKRYETSQSFSSLSKDNDGGQNG